MTQNSAIPFVDLAAQYESIKDEIDDGIRRVLQNGAFILGPETSAFEREFAGYCGVEHCVACANGTDALALGLRGFGIGPGDEVITVAHTFIATAEAILLVGAVPVFVDVRDDTLLMDVSKVEAAITPRTKAVIPVHLYGQTVDMDPLMEIAGRRSLRVIEDAAQAHGAKYKGRRAGSFADAAAFSFYPSKNLGAYGDAGAVTTHDKELASWLQKARNHGRSQKHKHEFASQNSRFDDLQAAVLRVKLPYLDSWNEGRRAKAAIYEEGLRDIRGLKLTAIGESCTPVYHIYAVRIAHRDVVLKKLRESGVAASIHYPVPVHRQEAFLALGSVHSALPVTEKAARELISLPIYPEISKEDVIGVILRLRTALVAVEDSK